MAPQGFDGKDEGRRAFVALVGRLPPVAGRGVLGRVLAERPGQVREALARSVPRAAFALAAAERGLLAGDPGRIAREAFAPVPEVAALGALPAEAVLAVLAATPAARARFANLEPEALGALYEGTLGAGVELAREPCAVLRPKRRAGRALLELAIGLTSLARRSGALRASALREQGVEVPASVAERLAVAPDARRLGRILEETCDARLVPAGRAISLLTAERRRAGAHYTPRALCERVVASVLDPLLGTRPSSSAILSLRVCDPAMGTGAFLLAACRMLAERLCAAEEHEGRALGREEALRRVAEACLFGVDRDAGAVEAARLSLWLLVGRRDVPLAFLDRALVHGEALLGAPAAEARVPLGAGSVDWSRAFSSVLTRGGFDAFVGNPPWVSYAGRAAEPLAPELRRAYAGYASFAGYRNLQGLFVERAARLLRPGGRLGFVLPSSMSELKGYAPARRAHDRWCEPDAPLADLGNAAFDGVFQPCMVLTSTRRAEDQAEPAERPWLLERPDLDFAARALMEKLACRPLPASLFGERGLQSMGDDRRHLTKRADDEHSVPLRAGGDVQPFRLGPPSFHASPRWFGARLRPSAEWQSVRFVVRQTARVPLAALSDGLGFRNSLLAGFEDGDYPASFLVAYLNSSPIRWLHYARHRDARQGMPQLKVGHLRATPCPPSRALVAELVAFGAALSTRGQGIAPGEQRELDGLVADSFELTASERERVRSWAENLR